MNVAQQRIERSYQCAMDIRDSMPSGADHDARERNENLYSMMYRKHYRLGDDAAACAFRQITRAYLQKLRKLASA
jgi:hypothetical protein